jgi:actin related protein 2/3 complex subunit 5
LQALRLSISDPPKSAKDPAIKAANAANVTRVLSSCPATNVERIINDLSVTEWDEVLKYVYKGLATGESCSLYLKWHAKLVEKGGVGCVMRAMVDRKV